MRTLIWIATAIVLVVWSGLAWIAHALLGSGGQLIAANADIIPADPVVVEWASWLASAGAGVGGWIIIVLWAVVSLALLALGYGAARLVPRFRNTLQSR